MEPRPTEAVPSALARTREVLFDGLDPGRWMALAFAAWLATLGGGRTRFRIPGAPSSSAVSLPAVDETWASAGPWLALVFAVVVLVGVFAVAFWVVLAFLNSRGAFLLVDGVVRERPGLVDSWRRYAGVSNDLFLFRVHVGLVVMALVGLPLFACVGGIAGWAWLDPQATWLVPVTVALAISWGIVALGVTTLYKALFVVIDDVVVPTMYVRRCSVLEGLGAAVEAAGRWPGAALAYAGVRFGVGAVLTVLGLVLTVLFCCVQWIPFVDVLVVLPLIVYLRVFGLHVAAQLAPDLARLGSVADAGDASGVVP